MWIAKLKNHLRNYVDMSKKKQFVMVSMNE